MTIAAARSAMDQLGLELGGRVPDGLAALTDAELQQLSERISRAKRRERAAVNRANRRALTTLPWSLRAPFRAVVGLVR
ncbi:hypothetical protein JGU71_06555 [Antrihabitans sp. YC3-6]|uniref:Uncharacterized protein n=1 Tax=Antrihabitans stalagmiti TaxID=2799499 RepID=A0A934U305_9NOCA|nr:hypothetical protein [Antrihabitans stalagmiti]MBJ8338538.1 hypothetical protein [Antrihabitans stalagmiti]